MPDPLTLEQRHRCMSHIRSRNTKPELKVRRWLWQHGYRYRLNVPGVPGKPDIVMRRFRTAIFVNGCFWHGHEGCPKYRLPQTNVDFWQAKVSRNRERDQRNYQILSQNGWQVIVVWECQLTPRNIEQTMAQVEWNLNHNLLDIIRRQRRRKPKPYIAFDAPLPIAAEDETEYPKPAKQ